MATKTLKQCLATNDLETCYARYCTTSPNWRKHWWDGVMQIWESCKEWANAYILDPINKTLTKIGEVAESLVIKIKRGRKKIPRVEDFKTLKHITALVSPQFDIRADYAEGNKVYLFKFYTDDGLLCSKIGTTKNPCHVRMSSEVRDYNRKGAGITQVSYEYVINCGEAVPEGFESYLRALYIQQYPNTWKANDRFFGVDIPTDDFKQKCEEYMERGNN